MGKKKTASTEENVPKSDVSLVQEMWDRYTHMKDGHEDYLAVNDKCGRFWYGDQWEEDVLAKLRRAKRPALTMNMILTTTDTILGEQINNRNEIRFRPRYGKGADATADALNKVYKHISAANCLQWLRSDVFEDGLITGRGFYDVRLDFSDNMLGEVRITRLDAKNVMIDPDATEYDPQTWNDVAVTRWMTPLDIELLYGKEKADEVKKLVHSSSNAAGDILDSLRDRVATAYELQGASQDDSVDQAAYVRVYERQYRVMVERQFFINAKHGDMRPVPEEWAPERVSEYLQQNPDVVVLKRVGKRIRWTVVAGNTLLHDGWSPYEHFTVVPYFPHFRNGRSVGVVEQLISAQELLNKTMSQELHVVNTTANSGWKVKKGALANMTTQELEARGAETGLVIEVDGPVGEALEKIQPNSIPSGIDRLSQKAEAMIHNLGVSEYMRGDAREDVSAKALLANQNQGKTGLARVLDNLSRSDTFLARVILHCVQNFYIEERVLYITGSNGKADESIVVNQVTPEGEIVNDLTTGEYMITVDSVPARESMEDSQFEQALALREQGVNIPDAVLIQNSRLFDKQDIIKQIEAANSSPLAQRQQEVAVAQAEADVEKTRAESQRLIADAQNKTAQAEQKAVDAQITTQGAVGLTGIAHAGQSQERQLVDAVGHPVGQHIAAGFTEGDDGTLVSHAAFLHVGITQLIHLDHDVVRGQRLFVAFQLTITSHTVTDHVSEQGDYGAGAFLVLLQLRHTLDNGVRAGTGELVDERHVAGALPEIQRPYGLLFGGEARKVSHGHDNTSPSEIDKGVSKGSEV